MLKFNKIELYSSKKIEVLDGERKVIINVEYYNQSNLELITNLEILHIKNELLPVHYNFEFKKNSYLKKLIMFSKPKTLGMKLEDLSITSNDLENIYRTIKKLKNSNILEITLLVNTNAQEVLYTFDKVYRKEFK